MNTQYPQYIYETPESWGNETLYATATGIEHIMGGLENAFDEPFTGTLSECDEYKLVSVCNDGTAAYREQNIRFNHVVVIFKHYDDDDPEYFEYVTTYHDEHDDEELTALGVKLAA